MQNTAVGNSSGHVVTTDSNLTLLGYNTGAALAGSGGDTFIGSGVGASVAVTGSNDILIGTGNAGVDLPTSSTSNYLCIAGGTTCAISATAINTSAPVVAIPGSLLIAGVPALKGTLLGNTTVVNTSSGSIVSGHIPVYDSNGNLVDSGVTPGAGTGIGTVNSGLTSDLAYYGANGTAVSPLATANSGLLNTDSLACRRYCRHPQSPG